MPDFSFVPFFCSPFTLDGWLYSCATLHLFNHRSQIINSFKTPVNKPFASSPVPAMGLWDWSYKSEQTNQEPLHFVLSLPNVFSFAYIISFLGYVRRLSVESLSHFLNITTERVFPTLLITCLRGVGLPCVQLRDHFVLGKFSRLGPAWS